MHCMVCGHTEYARVATDECRSFVRLTVVAVVRTPRDDSPPVVAVPVDQALHHGIELAVCPNCGTLKLATVQPELEAPSSEVRTPVAESSKEDDNEH